MYQSRARFTRICHPVYAILIKKTCDDRDRELALSFSGIDFFVSHFVSVKLSSENGTKRRLGDTLTFTPLKIINADFSSQVQIHKDLHHYVPQNQLIDLFFPPKRYGSTQWRSSRDRTLPGEFSLSSMSELAGGCSERSSDPLSRMQYHNFFSGAYEREGAEKYERGVSTRHRTPKNYL